MKCVKLISCIMAACLAVSAMPSALSANDESIMLSDGLNESGTYYGYWYNDGAELNPDIESGVYISDKAMISDGYDFNKGWGKIKASKINSESEIPSEFQTESFYNWEYSYYIGKIDVFNISSLTISGEMNNYGNTGDWIRVHFEKTGPDYSVDQKFSDEFISMAESGGLAQSNADVWLQRDNASAESTQFEYTITQKESDISDNRAQDPNNTVSVKKGSEITLDTLRNYDNGYIDDKGYVYVFIEARYNSSIKVEYTPCPGAETDVTRRVWSENTTSFTGLPGDYNIVWYKYTNKENIGGSWDFEDGVVTITGDAAVENQCYGVSALIKNISPNTKYTVTYKEKTNFSEVTNPSNGLYPTTDTLVCTASETDPTNTNIAEVRKDARLESVHNSAVEDGDWEERSFTWVSGYGIGEGYDTLMAKFTFIVRNATGYVQIKDMKVVGEAGPEYAPAPTKSPEESYETPVHTSDNVDVFNTDDVFQYHYAGGTDAYNSGESNTGKCYDVYLWVPQHSTPETLRGLVAGASC